MTDSAPKQEPPYGLRMPPDLKARVKAAAEANNRSMNAEIVATLEEKYPEPKSPEMSAIDAAMEYLLSAALSDPEGDDWDHYIKQYTERFDLPENSLTITSFGGRLVVEYACGNRIRSLSTDLPEEQN